MVGGGGGQGKSGIMMKSMYSATSATTAAAPSPSAWGASRIPNVGIRARVPPSVSACAAAMPGMGALRSSPVRSLSSAGRNRGMLHEMAGLGMPGLPGFGSPTLTKRRQSTGPKGEDSKQPLGLGIGLPVRAQAAAGGAALPAETPKKKILGIDAVTFKKVVPLGLMFFCILFNYTILRDTKDVLVVTAKGSSAEIIPFLKTWVNLPMAIGFMVIYTKLSNTLTKEQLFYSCIFPFIAFFGAFAFFMYPLVDVLHPTAFADFALEKLGSRFLGPIAIIRNWTFVLFYVMAELWGSVVVSVLFWGFANQVGPPSQKSLI